VKVRIFILVMPLLLFLQACVSQPYLKENAALIVFKTPTFRYADMGFIYENSDEVKVEIYGNGQALMTLKMTQNSVCMSLLECMSKKSFNQKVLSATYPESILNNIFQGKVIFAGLNLKQTRNGFTQKLMETNKYNINYSVLNKQIIFRDTINDILIKVKRLK